MEIFLLVEIFANLKIFTEFVKRNTGNVFDISRFAKINIHNFFVEQGFSIKKLNLDSSHFSTAFLWKDT